MGRWKSLAVRMVGKALQKALFGDLDKPDVRALLFPEWQKGK